MTRRAKVTIAVIATIIVGLSAGAYGYYRWQQSQVPPDAINVIEAVSEHFVLPTDEEPAILTVVNKGDVSSAFLKGKVEDGDKVLIYQKTQKVIIYRPSLDKIIDAGRLSLMTWNRWLSSI